MRKIHVNNIMAEALRHLAENDTIHSIEVVDHYFAIVVSTGEGGATWATTVRPVGAEVDKDALAEMLDRRGINGERWEEVGSDELYVFGGAPAPLRGEPTNANIELMSN